MRRGFYDILCRTDYGAINTGGELREIDVMQAVKAKTRETCPKCSVRSVESKARNQARGIEATKDNTLYYGIRDGRLVRWICDRCGWVYEPSYAVPAKNNRASLDPMGWSRYLKRERRT